MWCCAFCGRYHTRLTPSYGFDGWKRSGKTKARDSLCMKGLFYTSLLRDKDHNDEKIQSMHFDAGKWILEINGKPVEFPVMLSWPDGFSADAW